MPAAPPFLTRLWFAYVAFLRVLVDAGFAARAWAVRDAMPAPPEPAEPAKLAPKKAEPAPKPAKEPAPAEDVGPRLEAALAEGREEGALLVLGLLQGDGRLIDFLQQDVEGFSDADIGAAVRVVHEGCRKALKGRVTIEAIRAEREGERVTLPAGFDRQTVKLTGDVKKSDGDVTGTLRHKGWRAAKVALPQIAAGHSRAVLCPAEVEL